MADLRHIDLIALVTGDVQLKRVASTNGGEFAGPCPGCGGKDRFRVWPSPSTGNPRFWCRQCDAKGDAISYLRWREPGLSFGAALARLGMEPDARPASPPPPRPRAETKAPALMSSTWQDRAREFVNAARAALWADDGARALAWLKARGFSQETIDLAGLGYNPSDRYEDSAAWGMPDRAKKVYLPRGVVIPWYMPDANQMFYRVNIRRPAGRPKYLSIAGYANALYGCGRRVKGGTVVLVEGEFDAISLAQEVGIDRVAPVATGSTGGGRGWRWLARLSLAGKIKIAFDNDAAGDQAAAWWLARLDNAERLPPTRHDVNEMHQNGDDLRAWLGFHDVDQEPARPKTRTVTFNQILDEYLDQPATEEWLRELDQKCRFA